MRNTPRFACKNTQIFLFSHQRTFSLETQARTDHPLRSVNSHGSIVDTFLLVNFTFHCDFLVGEIQFSVPRFVPTYRKKSRRSCTVRTWQHISADQGIDLQVTENNLSTLFVIRETASRIPRGFKRELTTKSLLCFTHPPKCAVLEKKLTFTLHLILWKPTTSCAVML